MIKRGFHRIPYTLSLV